MAVFFLFLRNVLLPIEILKIKILEHSDPPSQHFSVHKAFSHFYFCRGKVMLCHLAEWHNVRVICNFAVDYCPHSSVLTILSSYTFQFDNIFFPLISSF